MVQWLGHCPFTAGARVRISLGIPLKIHMSQQLEELEEKVKNLTEQNQVLQESCNRKDDALRACRIFVTPIARRRIGESWDEYTEDAHRRLIAEIGTGV